ncbi:unnamed protein product [Vitrella brassicaformis CCMP3155]|uniref:Protein kinase domain-containing protein n=1 Tax=Vitrella brassicaformis (strain CCMP3155) TaxID=1169540 RepID=A0A0G4H303_VITBC|nr:unnamed protein product [Vitrella brassicaformis CCMP3155]|eukprot:CEM38079.1 unnamed protein product [Vitrella brassicaformis CCMP3155]
MSAASDNASAAASGPHEGGGSARIAAAQPPSTFAVITAAGTHTLFGKVKDSGNSSVFSGHFEGKEAAFKLVFISRDGDGGLERQCQQEVRSLTAEVRHHDRLQQLLEGMGEAGEGTTLLQRGFVPIWGKHTNADEPAILQETRGEEVLEKQCIFIAMPFLQIGLQYIDVFDFAKQHNTKDIARRHCSASSIQPEAVTEDLSMAVRGAGLYTLPHMACVAGSLQAIDNLNKDILLDQDALEDPGLFRGPDCEEERQRLGGDAHVPLDVKEREARGHVPQFTPYALPPEIAVLSMSVLDQDPPSWQRRFGIPDGDPKAERMRKAASVLKEQLRQRGVVYVGEDGKEYLRVGEGAAVYGVGLLLRQIITGDTCAMTSWALDHHEAAADEQDATKASYRRDLEWALRWGERLAAMRDTHGAFHSVEDGETPIHKRQEPELLFVRSLIAAIEEIAVACLAPLPSDRPPLATVMAKLCELEKRLVDGVSDGQDQEQQQQQQQQEEAADGPQTTPAAPASVASRAGAAREDDGQGQQHTRAVAAVPVFTPDPITSTQPRVEPSTAQQPAGMTANKKEKASREDERPITSLPPPDSARQVRPPQPVQRGPPIFPITPPSHYYGELQWSSNTFSIHLPHGGLVQLKWGWVNECETQFERGGRWVRGRWLYVPEGLARFHGFMTVQGWLWLGETSSGGCCLFG